ncbi:unnamed protein product [Toxocara canis]|uniref:MFS domain-containing protein n=1 Tax=Toxocara canis TaxID=6265 RepID=A0A183VDH1_TOXCA|nr:unnamed protein product [Toxocara canis]
MTKKIDPEAARQHEQYIAHLHENPAIAFHNETRNVIMVISIVCLAWLMGNSLILNFTIICMTDDEHHFTNNTQSASSQIKAGALYHYTNSEKAWLFAAVAIGTTAGTYPVIVLETAMSVRNVFTLFGALSGISTLLVPLSAFIGFWCLFLMRFLQGFALAISYPVLGAIVTNWSSLKQSGMYTAWMSCNLQFGAMFTLPTSGEFCVSSFGWEGVYYVQGTLTLISYLIFYLLFRDSPRIHG